MTRSLRFTIALLAAMTIAACGETQKTDDRKPALKPYVATHPSFLFETSMGNFTVQLDDEKAPLTVKNFIAYVDADFYAKTIFHRVINGFMIQGGGFIQDMTMKPTKPPVANEADNGLLNTQGTIAMARTAQPDSATSQFFINVIDNPSLNHQSKNLAGWGYTVFGQVTKGMDTVNAIKTAKVGVISGYQNVPLEPIVIHKVSLVATP